jgi:prevent-host-death family protein
MARGEPITQTMKATDVRRDWSRLLNRVFRGETRVLVEKRGIPVAALVSVEDLRRLQQWDARRDEHFTVIDRMRAAFKDVPDDDLEREVANAVSEARAELRAEREHTAGQL